MPIDPNKTRALKLPFVGSILNYTFSTTIAGASYRFDVHFNERDEAWRFSLFEADSKPIIYGVKIVLGAFLGRKSRHRLFADGVFVAMDLSGKSREATFEDLGTRVVVQWVPALELIRRLGLPA
jgi:hypothetical protein